MRWSGTGFLSEVDGGFGWLGLGEFRQRQFFSLMKIWWMG
jgi:hypothetical protein